MSCAKLIVACSLRAAGDWLQPVGRRCRCQQPGGRETGDVSRSALHGGGPRGREGQQSAQLCRAGTVPGDGLPAQPVLDIQPVSDQLVNAFSCQKSNDNKVQFKCHSSTSRKSGSVISCVGEAMEQFPTAILSSAEDSLPFSLPALTGTVHGFDPAAPKMSISP